MKSKIASAIKRYNRFLVTTHVQPDGDGLGAMLAAARLLKKLGKDVRASIGKSEAPRQYRFLPGFDELAAPDGEVEVFMAVDVANRARLGDLAGLLDSAAVSINIDHHPDNPGFADLNWVEPGMTSASELVYELWRELDIELDADSALCLYTGMVTDTGRWQYSNTTPRALRVAARLLEQGVNPNAVFQQIYERNSISWLRLLSLGLGRAVFNEELGLAWVYITNSDLAVAGGSLAEVENLVDWLRSVESVRVAVVLKELKKGEIKASVRSRGSVNVGGMAGRFGGGGHKNAAGFISNESAEAIIAKISEWLAGAPRE